MTRARLSAWAAAVELSCGQAYAALVVEKIGEYADDDPEYEADAASDIDLEVAEFELADPKDIPKDEGDAGTAEPPSGAA
jgi:hypothetical protein